MMAHKKDKKGQQTTGGKIPTAPSAGNDISQKQPVDGINIPENVQRIMQERDEYISMLQRERADFINFKKRVEEEKRDIISFGQSVLLLKWIPLYELLNKAMEHLPAELQSNDWVKGIVQIKNLFDKLFQDLDIQKIDAVGKPFSSAFHEAMMQVPGPAGVVMAVLETGYTFQGKVIKTAKVSVGNGANDPSEQDRNKTKDETISIDDTPTI